MIILFIIRAVRRKAKIENRQMTGGPAGLVIKTLLVGV